MKRIGLTGGIASGKSTVARLLVERGIPVIDADRVSRELVAPGQPVLAAIADAFGADYLNDDGSLNRSALRTLIMADPSARARLNALTHPAIRDRIAQRIGSLAQMGHPEVVVEAAILVETGWHKAYPYLIVVACSPQRQIERVMARDGISEEEARATLAAQLPMADKLAVATHVIQNDGDFDALEREVDRVWRSLTA